ncbi:hypothetical protein P3T23_008544 [Paraburkholderia sp. GAS448]
MSLAAYSGVRSDAVFLDETGNERRNVFDLHYSGKTGRADWDVESMLQTGHVGTDAIRAWAIGSLGGYTFDAPWAPHIGLPVDAASGDSHPGDGTLRTFNQVCSRRAGDYRPIPEGSPPCSRGQASWSGSVEGPIQCLSVPKTRSTVLRRMVIASRFRSRRRCTAGYSLTR